MNEETLKTTKKAVFSCAPVANFDFPKLTENLTWDNQARLFKEIFEDDRIKKYPIKASYQLNFLQNLITTLNHTTDEVHDDIYDYFCNLKITDRDEDFTYRHFIYDDNDHSVVLKEAQSIISCGTTGLRTWSAAFKLIDWAVQHKDLLAGKDIIELGSGTGLAGLLIFRLCQLKSLCLTDCHQKVLDLLKENIRLNQELSITVEELWWGDNLHHRQLLESLKSPPDYILASDVIYDEVLFEPLMKTVKFIFSLNKDCKFVIVCTVRNEETLANFVNFLQKDGEIAFNEVEHVKSSLFPLLAKTEEQIIIYEISLKN